PDTDDGEERVQSLRVGARRAAGIVRGSQLVPQKPEQLHVGTGMRRGDRKVGVSDVTRRPYLVAAAHASSPTRAATLHATKAFSRTPTIPTPSRGVQA